MKCPRRRHAKFGCRLDEQALNLLHVSYLLPIAHIEEQYIEAYGPMVQLLFTSLYEYMALSATTSAVGAIDIRK